jgi:hypothetical protein
MIFEGTYWQVARVVNALTFIKHPAYRRDIESSFGGSAEGNLRLFVPAFLLSVGPKFQFQAGRDHRFHCLT